MLRPARFERFTPERGSPPRDAHRADRAPGRNELLSLKRSSGASDPPSSFALIAAADRGPASEFMSEEEERMRNRFGLWTLTIPVLAVGTAAGDNGGGDPWADAIVDFVAGVGGIPGYGDPQTALGSPERFTGEGVYPSAVTMFNPAFGFDEIVSIGEGGSLTVRFDEPVIDDPSHPFGADLIVFGNGGFVDSSFPFGVIDPVTPTFGVDTMHVSVSANGVDYFDLGAFSEGFVPAQGYLDVDPFSGTPGDVPSDFTRPVNPALSAGDFAGLTYAQALALYDGSGGGTPIDISAAGLPAISFVRIDVPADPSGEFSVELDAVAAVPEPSSVALIVVLGVAAHCALRRRK